MSSRYASLCSGIGGLDLAVEAVFGYQLAWHSEYADDPAMIHDRHWPGIKNLGDLTVADWQSLEPVELICAGYPCQPFSHAGARRGEEDERHLWPYINQAVRVLRPRWVVLENVAGHLSLGFGTVLGDLAEAGYDAEWCCVRASDVGAPHGRLRLFVLASSAPDATGHQGRLSDRNSSSPAHTDRSGGEARSGRPRTGHAGRLQPVVDSQPAASDAERGGRHGRARTAWWGADGRTPSGWAGEDFLNSEGFGRRAEGIDDRMGTTERSEAPADADDLRHERSGSARGRGAGPEDSCIAPTDTHGQGSQGPEPAAGHNVPAWGDYEPAVRRWEHLTRPVPRPTDARGRLAPEFVEWMMGYPKDWTAGLRRPARLKALGNAVVPQQGTFALSLLLEAWSERAAT